MIYGIVFFLWSIVLLKFVEFFLFCCLLFLILLLIVLIVGCFDFVIGVLLLCF